jgi:hypothetical protein
MNDLYKTIIVLFFVFGYAGWLTAYHSNYDTPIKDIICRGVCIIFILGYFYTRYCFYVFFGNGSGLGESSEEGFHKFTDFAVFISNAIMFICFSYTVGVIFNKRNRLFKA